jgi:hypothetical protein
MVRIRKSKKGEFKKDFVRGFKKGFGTTLQVGGHMVPVVGGRLSAVGKEIKNLHKGGRVPSTGNYRLRAGELVLNKTQLARMAKAKTAKAKAKVINEVKKKVPRKSKTLIKEIARRARKY